MINTKTFPSNFHETAFSCEVLFIQPANADFYQCLSEGFRFVSQHPEVLEWIERDQNEHGLSKKKIRVLDRIIEHEKLEWLEFFDDTPVAKTFEISPLQVGRPRINPLTVYLYLLAEAYLGGSTTNRMAQNYLADSQTIFAFLIHHQIKSPGASTIHDNLRCISPATIGAIFDLQVKMIKKEEWDSFDRMFVDSTSVRANSAWPTDSDIMHRLAKRILRILTCLHKKFGVAFSDKVLSRWIELFDKLDFKISLVRGKANADASRKKLYGKFLVKIRKFTVRIAQKMKVFRDEHRDAELGFSEKQRVNSMVEFFSEALSDLLHVSEYCHKRIFEDENISSREKILSLSDGDAAFIIKGGRETVLGYKPQIVVSDKMFVSSVLVPDGNAADSDMLTLAVNDSIARTGVTPRVLSADDGYVSKNNLAALRTLGIETVSFSGSKGKKLLEKEWDLKEYVKARNDRSKAESIMFSLKYLFDFGQLQRRGVEETRVELTMKAVIYNFYHMVKMRASKTRTLAA